MENDFKIARKTSLGLGNTNLVGEQAGADRPYEVRSISRAISILDAFGDEEALSLVELSKRVQLPKPTLFRLAAALEGEGILERGSQGEYRLGYRLVSMAREILSGGLVQAGRHLLQELFGAFGHTVNLGVLSGNEVLFIDVCESRHRLRMVCEIGAREPVHATAIGKAMAAACCPERLAAILRDNPFRRLTRRTITSRVQFDAELAATRARGFAIDLGECQENANCVAAAVFDRTGVIAGISVSALASQLPEEDLPLVGAAVMETARQLSEKLGWHRGERNNKRANHLSPVELGAKDGADF